MPAMEMLAIAASALKVTSKLGGKHSMMLFAYSRKINNIVVDGK
jgi:hypothetical protein